jgi:DNA-directed RNA polymerase specialized sigma24 family protein
LASQRLRSANMAELDELVRQTVAGEAGAWPALQAAVQPTIAAIARSHRSLRAKGLASLPDDVAEVTTATLERLARTDFQNLRRYCERADSSGGSFDTWLYGIVDFVIRDHLRQRYGRAPKAELERPQPSKRDLQSQAGRLDGDGLDRLLLSQVGMTMQLTVTQIFDYIERHFAPDETRALRMYFREDASLGEIAHALGLPDAKAADKLIRRCNARLRYRFLAGDQPDGKN